jgi:hypothetical protein
MTAMAARATAMVMPAMVTVMPVMEMVHRATEMGDGGCGPGEMLCNGFCLNVQTDPLNCGNCGNGCGGFELCGEGMCKPEKYVFATSTLYVGNFGAGLADMHCLEAASAGGLPNGGYRAWISTANSSPSSWGAGDGVYRLPQGGEVVAYSRTDLMDGDLAHPIDRDEHGQMLNSVPACGNVVGVWTGTTPQGMFGGPDCAGWTSNVNFNTGRIGDASASDATWSFVGNCDVTCDSPMHIYCVQQ